MALREDQIQRYGRQILLREVGGVGQQKLLAAPVRVLASSPAIDVAVAYLVAGGTPVELAPGVTIGGFLQGQPLTALSPDAVPNGPPALELLPPTLRSEAPTQVVVGGGLAFRTGAVCPDCWGLVLAALPAVAPDVATGSLAALVVQRLALGWSPPLGVITWSGGQFTQPAEARCPRHSAAVSGFLQGATGNS